MTALDTTPPVDRAALARLEREATDGPWHQHSYGHRSIRQAAGAVLSALLKGVTTDLTYVHADGTDGEGPSVALTGNGPKSYVNAAFIAAAREAVPALLAENERLREALGKATLVLHYAERHQSVRLGRLISGCTDGHCPEFNAALSEPRP